MNSIWSGHDILASHLQSLNFSATPLTESNKLKHWTGKCWTLDSRSGQWAQEQSQQQLGDTQAAQAPHSQPNWLNVVDASSFNDDKWDAWLQNQTLLDATSLPPSGDLSEDRLSVVVTSPVHLTGFNRTQSGPTALRYVSLRQDRFLSILQKLAIHRGYLALLEEGSPCVIKRKSTVQGRACEVYILRTSNGVKGQSAITVTHFPAITVSPDPALATTGTGVKLGAKTNALIAGFDEEDLEVLTSYLCNFSGTFPSAAARLIIAFLEVEKKKRFDLVRTAVRDMQAVIHELTIEPVGVKPSMRRALNKTVDLYFGWNHLRTDGLVAWRDQLKLLRGRLAASGSELETQGDRREAGGEALGGGDLEDDETAVLVEYLDQLTARYDHRIARCDMVLQGASLAYQMETTQLSRKDTEIAIGDGKTMKAIAVLTMVFLPGTFIATMLAVPQIEEALKPENNASFSDRTWLWYIVLAVPVTVVALLVYISWEYLYKRKYLKSLFGESGSEKNDEVEMLDLERGRGGVAP